MIKNIYKIGLKFCLAISLFNLQSCDSLLDIDPKDAVDQQHIYNSVKQFEFAVVGVYSQLNLDYNILLGSIMADDCNLASDNSGVNSYGVNINRWIFSADDDLLQQIWNSYYYSIYKVNILLENIDNVPFNSSLEQQKLHELKAELYGLRVLIHFELHRIFGQSEYLGTNATTIPYKTNSDIFEKPSKFLISDFYNKLWDDLSIAELERGGMTNIRLNQDVVYALSARIALYQKDYQKAIYYATLLIDKYPLGFDKEFAGIWEDTSNIEVIFKLKRNNDDTIRPNIFWYDYNSGKYLYYASQKLRAQFDTKNDKRYQYFFGEDNNGVINKYNGSAFNNRINDYKVFRIGEMYLIRSEAFLLSGNMQSAVADLNLLRENRMKELTFYTNITISEILQERFLELSFEGHRYFDLKRLGLALQRDLQDLATTSDSQKMEIQDEHYQLPIPQKEILANPNLK
ncbi:RagB/SusD family nutrient uptake outer membrane protein [Myroides injenensis]|uniref:RagB/SusD family nutrient uptake outer membrane protein n=1 Tax=Myroides injenensis TaxID=1183151 RepID=UPI00226F84EF|nr:RagB/SusD family nutrient uptake outer membrane protein [Myroides injenensis]